MTKPSQEIYARICSNDVTLVLYPPYVGSSNAVASFLTVKNITSNLVYIMTQDMESINSAVGQDLSKKIFLPYDTSKGLTSSLKTKSTLIIDSLVLFRMSNMGPLLSSRKKECHLVILESSDILPSDEQYLRQLYPQFSVLTYLLSPQQPELVYKLEQTHMSSLQSRRYDKCENDKDKLRIGNFIYPEGISVESETPTDDDRGEGGWLTKSIIGKVREYSPKISNLLTIILSRYEDKHVVYTRFKNRSGLDLLNTLLNYLDVPHIVMTQDDDNNEQIGKITTFSNEPHQKVLITNAVPPSEICDVTHVHFLEGITDLVLKSFLRHVYRANLFKNITPLSCKFHFHIASLPNSSDKSNSISIDGEMYTKVANDIIERRNVYERLLKTAGKICFDRVNSISVI